MNLRDKIIALAKVEKARWNLFRENTNLTVGSLFAGIGGIDLGLERTGCFKTVWQVEQDNYAVSILKKIWHNVPKCRLVQKFPPIGNWKCDLICGGFPCQPISQAGKGKGREDKRWLWPEYYRVVNELKPKFILIENVPRLLTINDGEVFEEILNDLAKSGYDAEWQVLSAAGVGAPHLRKRVFIFAYFKENTNSNSKAIQTQVNRWEECFNDNRSDIRNVSNSVCKKISNTQKLFSNGSDNNGEGRSRQTSKLRNYSKKVRSLSSWWELEPDVGRVANGVPFRVDRLKCLGNAVVPQVAELVGEWMLRRMYEENMT